MSEVACMRLILSSGLSKYLVLQHKLVLAIVSALGTTWLLISN